MVHRPSKKQLAFLMLPHSEAFFGGSAGGGKSDALLMAALQYVDIPGYSAIIFRNTLTELKGADGLIPRAKSWLAPFMATKEVKWDGSVHSFFFATVNSDGTPGDPARLEFGFIGQANAETKYQGRAYQFCVDPKTLVWMADGSRKPMSDVKIGDYVFTLDGPKRVTKKHKTVKPCVAVKSKYGVQIQSTSHRLFSSPFQSGAYTTTESYISHTSSLQTEQTNYGRWLSHEILCRDRVRTTSQVSQLQLQNEEMVVSQKDESSSYTRPFCQHSNALLLRQQFYHSKHQELSRQKDPYDCFDLSEIDDDIFGCKYKDYLDHCLMDSCQHDEYQETWEYNYQANLPSQVCVEKHILFCLPSDDLASIPKCNHLEFLCDHPYNSQVGWHASFVPVEVCTTPLNSPRYVEDITVEGASHYITEWGCVNSNCGWDELTHQTEADYQYLFSRRRKVVCPIHQTKNGEPVYEKSCGLCQQRSIVPLRTRAASNPGGIGHAWVKSRFKIEPDIDPEVAAAKGIKVKYIGKDPLRPYIPSRIEDNPHLDQKSYREGLQELDDLRRAQLEEGDWGASADARFQRSWFNRYSMVGDHYVLGRDGFNRSGAFSPREFMKVFFTIDPAASTREGSLQARIRPNDMPSWTVMMLWGLTPNYHLLALDMVRMQEEIPTVIKEMVELNRRWSYMHPQTWLIESNGLGMGVVQEASNAGLLVNPVRTSTDKIVKATTAINKAKMGRIWLPQQAHWLKECEDELFVWQGFPQETDDIIDNFSMAASFVSWPERISDAEMVYEDKSFLADRMEFIEPGSVSASMDLWDYVDYF